MKAGGSRSPAFIIYLHQTPNRSGRRPVKPSLSVSVGVRVPPDASTEGWARAGQAVPKTVGAKASVGSTPAPSSSFGGAAQKVVQLRAKQPGVRAPVRSSRTASALNFEPVAQKDQSAGMRRLRPHVRVVPGSLLFRGRLKGGRLPLKQVMGVRLLPPECLGKTSAGVA